MMTYRHGSGFCITGPLSKENLSTITGFYSQRAGITESWCFFVYSLNRLLTKKSGLRDLLRGFIQRYRKVTPHVGHTWHYWEKIERTSATGRYNHCVCAQCKQWSAWLGPVSDNQPLIYQEVLISPNVSKWPHITLIQIVNLFRPADGDMSEATAIFFYYGLTPYNPLYKTYKVSGSCFQLKIWRKKISLWPFYYHRLVEPARKLGHG